MKSRQLKEQAGRKKEVRRKTLILRSINLERISGIVERKQFLFMLEGNR